MKTVNKPWGNELWIADGVQTPYALKKILFKAGNRTSLQVHKKKTETNYVLSGSGFLEISDAYFNCDLYLKGNMSNDVINDHLNQLRRVELSEGVVFHVTPGHLHRKCINGFGIHRGQFLRIRRCC